jgi:hypothetical protein
MQAEIMNDEILCQKALEVLAQHLGHANTLRFLSLRNTGHFNYEKIRNDLFKDLSVDEIYNQAETHFNKIN